jgi:hypothetical protein
MRLIDAYALQDAIQKSKMQNPHTDARAAANHDFEHDHFMRMVAMQPTAQQEIVRCKDCKYWDKTTLEEGNDCISGPWENAVCDMLQDWDRYGELGEDFRRTNGDWFCADVERRECKSEID